MRYVLKQNIFSLGDDFTIKNEQGEDVYFVDGKVFSIGDKLSFQNMAGKELAFIKQKLLAFSPRYEIYEDNRLVAQVKKEWFTFFHCKFQIDVPGPDDIEAKGNFLDHEYQFFRGRHLVGSCSKRWFSWSDTYGIDVAPGEDPVLILASSIVIDMICHNDKGRH